MADTVVMPGGPSAAADPQGERLIGFLGRRAALIGILLVNSLLGMITLGFYRFWARTRLRRFFWNSIDVDGDPLEYTGRGLELFVGFLIVIAILVPISGGYSVVSLFLETSAPNVLNAVNFVYFISLLWLARYAYFRARRYRLARTIWRGIRAGQDGSASGYAWLWFGYAVLSVITLGWAVPWLTAELQKYEVENARFGVENFRYRGTGLQVLRAWVPCGALWTLAIVGAVLLTVTKLPELQFIFHSIQEDAVEIFQNEDPEAMGTGMVFLWTNLLQLLNIYAIVIFTLLVSIPFYFIYRIAALRFMFNVSNLSEVGFVAKFSAWRIVGNWVLYVVVSIVFVIILISLIGGVAAFAGASSEGDLAAQNIQAVSTLLVVLVVIALFMLLPIIKFILFHYPVIRHVATTLAVTDIDSLERVVQSSKDDPRFGEGLAAALDFDVGGF